MTKLLLSLALLAAPVLAAADSTPACCKGDHKPCCKEECCKATDHCCKGTEMKPCAKDCNHMPVPKS